MEHDCVVIGAGVVGLAVARALALDGRETIVIDAARRIGSGISARNSEVIHAGLYYAPGSLKAVLCVAGKHALYAFCDARGVPYRRCGKLLVATSPEQNAVLDTYFAAAAAASVTDLELLTTAQSLALEPALRCTAALLSPSTGIIDAHAYMLALQGEAAAHGAMTALGTIVSGMAALPDGLALTLAGEDGPSFGARLVINAAGLGAHAVARLLPDFPTPSLPPLHFAKGSYFSLSGRAPFSRLIYPLPQVGGLGVHLTLDLAGQARFGPDVEWVDTPDYAVDPARAAGFYAAIRSYWPGLPDQALSPAYAGIRPKLSGPGEPPADFMISGPADHGVRGLINLFGIESPGLTASLAIGDHVARLVRDMLD